MGHSVPLRFSQPRIIESFRKSRPLQLLKHILELGRFGSFVILGILEIRPSWGSFGTFGIFEEYLLRARSARYLRAYVGRPCHPNCLPDDRCVFSDAWDHLVASQTTTRALSSLNRLLVSIKLLGGPPPAAAFGSFGSFRKVTCPQSQNDARASFWEFWRWAPSAYNFWAKGYTMAPCD